MNKFFAAAAVVAFTASTAAIAAVTFDPATGTGFVGKGDVQLAFNGQNNAWLQRNAESFVFTYEAQTVTEVSWECTRAAQGRSPEKIQVREETTRSTVSNVLHKAVRERNQVTGFNLTGINEDLSKTKVTRSGQQFETCPEGDNWTLTERAGEPTLISHIGGLFVALGSDKAFLPY